MALFLEKSDYTNNSILSWKEKFPDAKIDLKQILKYKYSWNKLFNQLLKDPRMDLIKNTLEESIKKEELLFPYPDLLFNAFFLTDLKKISVCIIGQDPYYLNDIEDDIIIPQAMGLSFSVPKGIETPSSLKSIYRNLLKYKHIKKIPDHGNLEFWASQGCLMLNTSLTVIEGDKNKNCHKKIWKWFTNEIIKYISDNCEHIIFVLWGANALEKVPFINFDKHDAIISSHPSGLSCAKKLNQYDAFNDVDHFGKINKKLKDLGKREIVWSL